MVLALSSLLVSPIAEFGRGRLRRNNSTGKKGKGGRTEERGKRERNRRGRKGRHIEEMKEHLTCKGRPNSPQPAKQKLPAGDPAEPAKLKSAYTPFRVADFSFDGGAGSGGGSTRFFKIRFWGPGFSRFHTGHENHAISGEQSLGFASEFVVSGASEKPYSDLTQLSPHLLRFTVGIGQASHVARRCCARPRVLRSKSSHSLWPDRF